MEFGSVWDALAEGRHFEVLTREKFYQTDRYWAAGLISMQAIGWVRFQDRVIKEVQKLPDADVIEGFGEVARLGNPYISTLSSVLLSRCIGCPVDDSTNVLRDYDRGVDWAVYLYRSTVLGIQEVKDESLWVDELVELEDRGLRFKVGEYQEYFEVIVEASEDLSKLEVLSHDQLVLALERRQRIDGEVSVEVCRRAFRRMTYSRQLLYFSRQGRRRVSFSDLCLYLRNCYPLSGAVMPLIDSARRRPAEKS